MSELPGLPPLPDEHRPLPEGGLEAAVLRGRRRRNRAVLASTALVAAVATALISLTSLGGGSSSDSLQVADPDVTQAPSATSTQATTTGTPTTEPRDPTGTAAPPASSPTLSLGDAAMLSDGFVESEFGQGRTATRLMSYTSTLRGAIDTCYSTMELKGTALPEQINARSWYWPDEVVATEVLARESSTAAARQRFASCSNPDDPGFDRDASAAGRVGSPTVTPLDIGDESFVVRVSYPLYSAFYSGARVGADLVLVNLRQSGSSDTLGALRHALRAAVAKAEGRPELSPVAAPAQQPLPEMSPFLTEAQMPGSRSAPLTQWRFDTRATSAELDCNGTAVAVARPPLTRYWSPPVDGNDAPDSVRLSIAYAADPGAAHAAFSSCAGTLGTAEPIAGLGDEAVRGERGLGIPDGVVIRVGSTVLSLDVRYHSDPAWMEALGRAALGAYRAAQA
jgi:hypothetical protein